MGQTKGIETLQSGNKPVSSPRLISANDYKSPVAEEYRKLESIIVQLSNREQCRYSIMVSSCIGGEGKSITSLNLALSLAQGYDHDVLLIDTDLRNPSLAKYLGIRPEFGLTDCLIDKIELDEALISTGLGNLSFLPAGRIIDNPVELLSSRKMDDFFEIIKKRFRDSYIIFDTPPVLPFADTRVIGRLVDRVLFVVKEGGTSLGNITESLNILSNINILGLVYNKATTESLRGGYHYYYYDYNFKPRHLDLSGTEKKAGLFSRVFRGKSGS